MKNSYSNKFFQDLKTDDDFFSLSFRKIQSDQFDRNIKIFSLVSSVVFIAFKVTTFTVMFTEMTGSIFLGLSMSLGLLGASIYGGIKLIDWLVTTGDDDKEKITSGEEAPSALLI